MKKFISLFTFVASSLFAQTPAAPGAQLRFIALLCLTESGRYARPQPKSVLARPIMGRLAADSCPEFPSGTTRWLRCGVAESS